MTDTPLQHLITALASLIALLRRWITGRATLIMFP